MNAPRLLTTTLAPIALALSGAVCAQSPQPETAGPETATTVRPSAPSPAAESVAEFDHSHARWTGVLGRHVRGDRFDYGALAADPAELDAYLAQLHAITPEQLAGWTRDQRFAFWINVYNAHTIAKVVENYPLKSIRKLDTALGLNSVFDKEFIPMRAHHPEGKDDDLSLNDVEHKILRARFEDARLHAAINCASISCPPLLGEAFVAERLDAQLQAQMRAFVNDGSRNLVDPDAKRVRLSEIFKWFKEDFQRDAGSVNAYLARYLPEREAAYVRDARVGYLDYDWGLNDVERDDG